MQRSVTSRPGKPASRWRDEARARARRNVMGAYGGGGAGVSMRTMLMVVKSDTPPARANICTDRA